MSNIVDELVIAITADTADAVSNIKRVDTSLDKTEGTAKRTAQGLGGAFKQMSASITAAFAGLVAVLASAHKAFSTVDDFVGQANGLERLSLKTGIATKELDAWSKAAESVGGSAEALQASLASFYAKTGRDASEFFKLGQKLEGMSNGQKRRYLQASGVDLDAVPLFLKRQSEIDAIVKKYRATALNQDDIRLARQYKTALFDLNESVRAIGNALARVLIPVFKVAIDGLRSMVEWVRENSRLLSIFGGVVATALGVKYLGAIKAALAVTKAFGLTLAKAALPITAIAAALGALAIALEDLVVFARGGDSAFGDFLKGFLSADEIENVRNAFASVGDALSGVWDAVKPIVQGALPVFLKGVAIALAGVAKFLVTIIGMVVRLATAITSLVGGAIDAIVSKVQAVAGFFSSLFETISNGVSSVVGAVADSRLGKIVGNIASFFGSDNQRASETVTAEQARYGGNSSTVNTQAQLTVNNNFGSTPSNPAAVGSAVGQSVNVAGNRFAGLVSQSASGINLKGA